MQSVTNVRAESWRWRYGQLLTCLSISLGILAAGPSLASAALPTYDGGMTFEAIRGPADPEEYSWQVNLHDEQVLEAIDDRHAWVHEEGHSAFVISAEPAHDAVGSTVPTTLAVSEGEVITLTVHHRAGNPAAAGAPFVYPISFGAGWENGFSTVFVDIPDEPGPDGAAIEPVPRCVVPALKGWSLRADRRRLRNAGCRLGEVRGQRSKTAKVVKQDRKPGTVLAAGAEVGVKLSS